VTVFLCVSVFLCAVLLMGQVPELKWIGLDWIGLTRKPFNKAVGSLCLLDITGQCFITTEFK